MSSNLKLTNLLNSQHTEQNNLSLTVGNQLSADYQTIDIGFNSGYLGRQRDNGIHSLSNSAKKYEKQEIDKRLQELKDKRKQLLREKQKLRNSYNSQHSNGLKNQHDNIYNQQNATEADIGYLLQNIDTSAIDYGSAYLQSNYEYNISSPLKQIDSICKQPIGSLLKSGFSATQSHSSSDNTTEQQKSVRFKSSQDEQLKISQFQQYPNSAVFGNNKNQYSYQKIFQTQAQQRQIYSPVNKQKQYEIKRQMQQLSSSKGTGQFFESLKLQKVVSEKTVNKEAQNNIQPSETATKLTNNDTGATQSKQEQQLKSQAFINAESEIDAQEPTLQSNNKDTEYKSVGHPQKQENNYYVELQAQNQVNLQLRERCSTLAAQVEALKLELENQENLTEVERTTITLLEQQKIVQAQIHEELKAELKQYQYIERPLYALLALFNRKFKTPCHNGQLQNTIDAVNSLIDTNWAEVQTIAKSIMHNSTKANDGTKSQVNALAPPTQQTIQIQHALDRLIITIAKLAAQDPEKLVQLGPDGVQQLFIKIKQQQMNEKKQ